MDTRLLLEATESFAGVLLDAYGVFWSGNATGLIPGADAAMKELVKRGKVVGILSNATRLGDQEIEKVKNFNLHLGKHFHFFLTSGDITRYILLSGSLPFSIKCKKFFVLGGPYPSVPIHKDLFTGTCYEETQDISEAGFIYASTPQILGKDQTDPQLFRRTVEKCKQADIPMICSNPDLFAHEGKPPLMVVRQGSIARMYEEMGGVVYYIGKPYYEAYDKAMQLFGMLGVFDPHKILMIGDTPETDIRGANTYGLKSALLIGTGIMAERIQKHGLGKAMSSLSSHDIPNYFLDRLGI